MSHLPTIKEIELRRLKDSRNTVLFTSPAADRLSKPYLEGIHFAEKTYINAADRKAINKIGRNREATDVIYAVGGGTVIDVSRLVAKEWGVDVCCIPTAISTDAFLVDSTGLREDGCVAYVPSKTADEILIDWGLLRKTPLKYHLSGCGDVLSIYTALYDWKLANTGIASSDEIYRPDIACMAEGILHALIQQAEEIRKGSKSGIQTILNCLTMEVALCNLYGNSRPEEGGEHFFAYCIENKLQRFLHGEMVSFGVLITALIQGQDWRKIQTFMDCVGLDYMPHGMTRSIVVKTLLEMPEYVKKHKLRRSIYNDFNYEDGEQRITRFLDRVGLV